MPLLDSNKPTATVAEDFKDVLSACSPERSFLGAGNIQWITLQVPAHRSATQRQ